MEVNRPSGNRAFRHVEQVTIPTTFLALACAKSKMQRRGLYVHCHRVQSVGSYMDHDSMGIL